MAADPTDDLGRGVAAAIRRGNTAAFRHVSVWTSRTRRPRSATRRPDTGANIPLDLLEAGPMASGSAGMQPLPPGTKVGAAEHAIVVSQATKRFGSFVALEDLSLTVAYGTTLGVIGPSGAGKTTTIRL